MMNGPFFRNYSKQPTSQSSRSVPIQQTQQRSSPKVVSVPVHFVSSDQPRTTLSMLKDSAALKIQKVFRGYVVRKTVRKIASIRNEVSEIEQRIEDVEVVNSIRNDAKERLRVNETLMSLLFKLDSIRGADFGIRDLRKAVTRKAIALQEKVDSIAQTLDSPAEEIEIGIDNVTSTSSSSTEQVTKNSDSPDEPTNLEAIKDDKDGILVKDVPEAVIGAMETNPPVDEEIEKKDDPLRQEQKQKEGNTCSRRILQSLMDDNEKMMKLMAEISERNEMQTRMINSLSRRVEQLEKALVTTEKRRRKKKTRVSLRGRDADALCMHLS